MKEFNNKIYTLLTSTTLEVISYFKWSILTLCLYFSWSVYQKGVRRIIISIVALIIFAGLIAYLDKSKIIVLIQAPREKKVKKEDITVEEEDQPKEEFIMKVDDTEFSNFTFNDYVVDTFKAQDPNKILDIMSNRNSFIKKEMT